MSSYHVAVVGSTGNVGREILSILAERDFPVRKVDALASQSSIGKDVSYGEETSLPVQNLAEYDFKGVDIAFFSPGSAVSKKYAPIAAKAGAMVIDNTSCFRLEPDVPLIVPEVNPAFLEKAKKRRIIATPNCVAIPLTVALKPLHDLAPITRIVVSTYQSVSGAGRKAMDELYNQTRAIFMNADVEQKEFPKRIAFNVIPHIDTFMKDGVTGEENKIVCETKKILDPKIKITATCVRVPVFIGHAISANIEFAKEISVSQARQALEKAPGVFVVDQPENDTYATPDEMANEDMVAVSRIRQDTTVKHGLALWIVADNLRKGAALNAVQIAEELIKAPANFF